MEGIASIMKKSILNRFSTLIIVLLGVSILSFALISLSSADPALTIAQQMTLNPTDEQIQNIRLELGLDQPVYKQYLSWLGGVLKGDFGTSYIDQNPVIENLAEVFPNTLMIAMGSFTLIVILIMIIGIVSVLFKDRWIDHMIRVLTIIGICVPTFWLGFLLLIVFAVKIPLFDVVPNIKKVGFSAYVLPIMTLAFPYVCSGVRMFRGLLLNEYSSDYTTYLRARGATRLHILVYHNLKNAMPPMITWFASCAAGLLGGVAIIENVFSINGVGAMLITAINSGDSPTISFIVMMIAVAFVGLNVLADLINKIISPRYIGGRDDG